MFQAILNRLPRTATAPFCPSEVRGTINIPAGTSFWKKLLKFAGPGLLVSVGYMDPGNWATDIEAGSRYGYGLLFVILLSSLIAIFLQTLCLRLGIASRKDLARLCREHYSPRVGKVLWLMAELAIIACDLAEVLGTALAFHLLFGCSILVGVLLTAFDTLIVLGLKGRGFRQVEAIVLGLILTIALCFCIELILIQPDYAMAAKGLIPSLHALADTQSLYLAVAILGATVMPHNLYLHSSIVQTRVVSDRIEDKREAIQLSTIGTLVSLSLAFFVNAAIMILAASAFHANGHIGVADIEYAYHLLDPVVGSAFAGIIFGLALMAAGQSSTFTGTIAGQVIMEGFLDLKIPCWQRRLITRFLALIPALIGVLVWGEGAVGKLLVLSQVVLSMQLPFAIYPLLKLTGNRAVMGEFATGWLAKMLAWSLFVLISALNVWLIYQFFV
ncbi:Nramp family divalent metal transporter [Methyloradius palustris]|uniref:Divalent metal cation transporter MntH n=1 Tax=Methyloradius palustris TaxID=2778876 RepID=A0A8D5GA22_9PROT|nr:Nramp family divalent metal transporter [Methyloradius palustris]BCM25867.1 divalent metal cation transporter MntH 1 [Methyloradius palustris]